MFLADGRIELGARPVPPPASVLEVVMLGHCPGLARWDRVVTDKVLVDDIRALGFDARLARLDRLLEQVDSPTLQAQGKALLYGLPIPIHSFGQFQDLFPQAFDAEVLWQGALVGEVHRPGVLVGTKAWLPHAVQDFFEGAHSSSGDRLKLWLLLVEESEDLIPGIEAFLPEEAPDLSDPEELSPFAGALLISSAGVIALPDLERLLVPSRLEDVPPLKVAHPLPVFLPLSAEGSEQVQAWPDRKLDAARLADEAAVMAPGHVLSRIVRVLAKLRPDLQCLFALPFDAEAEGELPVPSRRYTEFLAEAAEVGSPRFSPALRHLQFIYPYLRGPGRPLGSPSGLVAGTQALVSQRLGPWHSIGKAGLPGQCLPWPPLSQITATALRASPGITVLLRRAQQTVVDDERLCVPCLPPVQLNELPPQSQVVEAWRSAEVMRFMGWLRRQLQALGERLVFDVDVRSPRPAMAVRDFLGRLHAQGALRGARPEDAFSVRQRAEGQGTLILEVEIAPTFPIDRLRITFLHDRNANRTSIGMEAANG